MEALGMSTAAGNSAYKFTTLSREEILKKHNSVMASFGIPLSDEDLDLPKLYLIPKLDKNPCNQRTLQAPLSAQRNPTHRF